MELLCTMTVEDIANYREEWLYDSFVHEMMIDISTTIYLHHLDATTPTEV